MHYMVKIGMFCLCFLFGGIGTANAQAVETHQEWAIACLSKMETETSWPECREGLFAPCNIGAIGSAEHLACLQTHREDWRIFLDKQTEQLNVRLTLDGANQLTELIGQWFGYVGNKCTTVAEAKAEMSADAARMGCEISEFAGLSTEFQSCLSGNSVSPYCILKN
jgi:hypothetical protein